MHIQDKSDKAKDPNQKVIKKYINQYLASHQIQNDSVDYRLGYWHLLIIDQIFDLGYSLLDVGCGTGGYHKLLINCHRIIGLDRSKEMVLAANDLAKSSKNKLQATFIQCDFSKWETSERYDVIDLVGTIGWYETWYNKNYLLKKALHMLNQSGFICLSFVPPKTVSQFLKSFFLPSKTVLISTKRIFQMIKSSGGTIKFQQNNGNSTVVFICKS